MSYWGVEVHLCDKNGTAYRRYGEHEGEDGDKAMEYAGKRVASHPNAAACIYLNGDPYAWVFNDTEDYAGVSRRTTDKQIIKYVGRGLPDSFA